MRSVYGGNQRMKISKRTSSRWGSKIIAVVVLACIFLAFIASKTWNINRYLVSGYELWGVDVSHYQGEIDWKQIENQGIDFAFIKATEGSSHQDERFALNWQAAAETELSIGSCRGCGILWR